jgi:lysyl-tRNA synthetase class 1
VAHLSPDPDWVSRFADEVIAEAGRRSPGKPIVVASGLSPSGPIHLGNLREVMVPHLVADEIRRRGVECVHILSWDDFDRLRKVPAGIDPSFAEHVGKPLTSVPAPAGSAYPNWAEHFRAPMADALARLGVEFRGIGQTEMYTSGAYTAQVLLAMRERARIDAVLGQYRTRPRQAAAAAVAAGLDVRAGDDASAEEATAEEAAAQGSGAAAEEDGATSAGYFPYKPYCSVCERDLTTVTSYDDATTELSYTCACGHAETIRLTEHRRGKLVWKVDWPMRWAYEGVVFEPSGVDHQAPGSSFTVGGRLVSDVRVRRHQRHGEDVQLPRRRPDAFRRAGHHGGAGAALAVRAAPAPAGLHDRVRPGDPAAVRRVGRGRAQGRGRHRFRAGCQFL